MFQAFAPHFNDSGISLVIWLLYTRLVLNSCRLIINWWVYGVSKTQTSKSQTSLLPNDETIFWSQCFQGSWKFFCMPLFRLVTAGIRKTCIQLVNSLPGCPVFQLVGQEKLSHSHLVLQRISMMSPAKWMQLQVIIQRFYPESSSTNVHVHPYLAKVTHCCKSWFW